MNISLLTSDDLVSVHETGLRFLDRSDLFVDAGGDEIALTIKGLQLLRYAESYWKTSISLEKIKTYTDFVEAAFKLQYACLEDLDDKVRAACSKGTPSGADKALNARFKLSGIEALIKDAC